MLSKVNVAVVAALFVASIAPINGFGQNFVAPQHHSQSKHLKVRVPFDAKASAADSNVLSEPAVRSGGRWFETDPDPRIRFEMNRDDRDRRSGG